MRIVDVGLYHEGAATRRLRRLRFQATPLPDDRLVDLLDRFGTQQLEIAFDPPPVFPKTSRLWHKVGSVFEEHFYAILRKFKLITHFGTDTSYTITYTDNTTRDCNNRPIFSVPCDILISFCCGSERAVYRAVGLV
jgi:hypothetical protein